MVKWNHEIIAEQQPKRSLLQSIQQQSKKFSRLLTKFSNIASIIICFMSAYRFRSLKIIQNHSSTYCPYFKKITGTVVMQNLAQYNCI